MTNALMRNEKDHDESLFIPTEYEEMKPCPKCGCKVKGAVYGGYAAFGCGEFGFGVYCKCGISFEHDAVSDDTPEAALADGIAEWNKRAERTCKNVSKNKHEYIWHCICTHEGFAEDREEWLWNCDIPEEEMNEFMCFITDCIGGLGDNNAD